MATLNLSGRKTENEIITNSRQFHKSLAPWVLLPLFISAVTETFYRISKALMDYSRDEV